MTTQTHIKTCEAMEATLYSTEQKFFGWIFSSTEPEKEWETVGKINPAKVTPFARKAFRVLQSLSESGKMDNLSVMTQILNSRRDRFFDAWLWRSLAAAGVYVSDPPTNHEKKEVGIL